MFLNKISEIYNNYKTQIYYYYLHKKYDDELFQKFYNMYLKYNIEEEEKIYRLEMNNKYEYTELQDIYNDVICNVRIKAKSRAEAIIKYEMYAYDNIRLNHYYGGKMCDMFDFLISESYYELFYKDKVEYSQMEKYIFEDYINHYFTNDILWMTEEGSSDIHLL